MPMAFLLKFFTNPRVIIGLLIAAVVAYGWWKYNDLQSTIEEQAAVIKQEKENNAVLRGNIETLTEVNIANERILKQQQLSAQAAAKTINKLAKDLQTSSKSFNGVQSRVDAITTPPVPLTPYLKEAIIGIQEQRAILAAPAAPASEPAK